MNINEENFIFNLNDLLQHYNNELPNELKRPSWDNYFLGLAFLVGRRSHDIHSKLGCVLVKNNKVIGVGYNGFPKKAKDNLLPLNRPDKYHRIIHSEVNAIANSIESVEGAICYTPTHPCLECSKVLIAHDILDWKIGTKTLEMFKNEVQEKKFYELVEDAGVNIVTLNKYDENGDLRLQWIKNTVQHLEAVGYL